MSQTTTSQTELAAAHPSRLGRLIVLSGASGSGKSTLVARLLEGEQGEWLRVSTSATTRSPRTGEVPGVSYHFVDRESFLKGIEQDAFLEWAEVHGHLYGTPEEPVRRAIAEGYGIILVIDVQGAMKVREKVPEALLIFVHAPDFNELETRLRARGTDDEATIQKRLSNARREVALADRYNHQIVNQDLDQATRDLASILQRECRGGA